MKKIDYKKYYKNTIHPLKQKEYQKKFIRNFIITSALFFTFSTIIVSFRVKNFQGNIIEKTLFTLIKNYSMMGTNDWIFFFTSSTIISLMLVNYSFYKHTKKTNLSAILLGTITATCPVCLLPLLGVFSLGPLLGKISYPIKILTIFILLFSTIHISNSDNREVTAN